MKFRVTECDRCYLFKSDKTLLFDSTHSKTWVCLGQGGKYCFGCSSKKMSFGPPVKDLPQKTRPTRFFS